MNATVTAEKCRDARKMIIEQTYRMGHVGAHVAPSLSLVECLVVLFTEVMDFSKDKFILSKGHGGLGYYTALYEAGILSREEMDTFEDNGGLLPGQPSKNDEKTIVYSSGSLGLGLSYAAGRAQANPTGHYYVLVGDGESNEGTIWESAMYIGYQKIPNLTVIVDYNKMQSDGNAADILDFDVAGAWKSFGFDVVRCGGHDVEALYAAYQKPSDGPKVILADTVKGKGISFMENVQQWHHNHLSKEQYQTAMQELEGKA